MRIRRIIAVAAVGILAATGFSACSNGGSDSASGTTSTGVPSEPPAKPDRLVIRIWSGDQEKVYADTAAKKFTADTGIPIVWDTTDEAVSYAKLNQEISSGSGRRPTPASTPSSAPTPMPHADGRFRSVRSSPRISQR